MNIDLYTTTSKVETVHKVLKNERIVTGCRLLDDTNILNPSILFRSVDIDDLEIYNYARIPQFTNRYYYIGNKTYLSGGIVRLDMEVDAVFSWYNAYKDTKQIIDRAENYQNRYICDGSTPIHSDNWHQYKVFGVDVFDKKCNRLILTTAGKGSV